MASHYVITLLAVIAWISASSSSGPRVVDPTTLSTPSPSTTSTPCTPSLDFIEQALANISSQLGRVGTRDPSDIGESLTSVTSLLQLSLLRELLGDSKKKSSSEDQQGLAILSNIQLLLNTSIQNLIRRLDTIESFLQSENQEGLAILSHIQLLLNTSIQDLTSRLDTIESLLQGLPSDISLLKTQVSHQSSNIMSIKSDTELLLKHANISHNTLTSIDDELDDDSNEYTPSPLLHSCEEIKRKWPTSPSDYYIIADSHGHARHVYCHMGTLCNSGEGWIRLAYLNMTDNKEKCPERLRLYNESGVRACGRPISSGGSCATLTFPSGNFKYSKVCGRIIGYQQGIPDGGYGTNNNIDSQYDDGISLTHGYPRNHIWTFVVGRYRYWSRCPCGSNNPTTLPSFVGNNYYCESGCNEQLLHGKFYYKDPLWDGHQCSSEETACCLRTGIPWFYRSLDHSTTDSIEMRICLNEGTQDEDCLVGQYEIYVK